MGVKRECKILPLNPTMDTAKTTGATVSDSIVPKHDDATAKQPLE